MTSLGLMNDKASSLRTYGRTVVFYEHANYTGSMMVRWADASDLHPLQNAARPDPFLERPHQQLAHPVKPPLTMWGAALAALSLTLTGCGSQEIRPEQGVTARLDAENGQVVMPVDAYSTSESDEAVMTRARLAILRHCLQKSGHNDVKPPPSDAQRAVEERPYGVWIVARAKVHGFDLPPGDETAEPTPPPDGWSDESDPAFQAAYDVCAAEVMDQMIAVSSPATSPQSTARALVR